jgi:ribosome-binding factor A
MGLRQDRLADQIRDVLAQCFQAGAMNDPRLTKVTITRVKVTSDLQLATIYFRLYADVDKELDKAKKEALKGLGSSKGYLRNKLASYLTVRRIPNLRFFYDDSQDKVEKIESLLRDIK